MNCTLLACSVKPKRVIPTWFNSLVPWLWAECVITDLNRARLSTKHSVPISLLTMKSLTSSELYLHLCGLTKVPSKPLDPWLANSIIITEHRHAPGMRSQRRENPPIICLLHAGTWVGLVLHPTHWSIKHPLMRRRSARFHCYAYDIATGAEDMHTIIRGGQMRANEPIVAPSDQDFCGSWLSSDNLQYY